ncbi:hypothetical protein VE04_04554 [Pseudogymnoascus sp. 24MN13]|nr:hypothetical protein VE04_04554 [Pseudogymnoascus sp. 24MN13]
MAKSVDYSLYLVTDSTPAILGGASLVDVVEAALEGGVTIVQYRDKSTETGVMVDTARRLHAVTKKYNVPLLINDRVDVALAVGCEGVHIGQDDIDIKTARRLLGESAIIGLTVASVEQALQGCDDGADYLGIGTIFATPTKTNTKDIIGTAGCQAILKAMAPKYSNVGTVCIGGINATNLQRVLYQSSDNSKRLDGIALVSAIIGAKDPKEAAKNLKHLVNTPPAFAAVSPSGYSGVEDVAGILEAVPSVIKSVNETNPLCHNMTNLVVQNFAASVALAIGGSPIMSNHGDEAADLAKLGGALVINMGTVTQEGLRNHLLALRAYNSQGGPVVLDPVGAAATTVRKSALKTLMAGGYFDLIKGNEGEIRQAYGKGDVQQRGVDSGASMLDGQSRAALVRDLAERERNIVLMTGSTDYVSDGRRTIAIKNGHEYLGRITGSGCVLGTTISAMLAVHRHDKLIAAVAGLLLFEIADELWLRNARMSRALGPRPAIFICDIQEKFRPAVWEYDKIILTTQKLLRAASILSIPVYATTQNAARLGPTCPELNLSTAIAEVDKTAFSMWPALGHHFSSSARCHALAAGHKVYIIADGVSSCNPQEIPIALARLRQAGAVVTTSESWLYECMGDAGITEFKQIAGVVKDTSKDTKRVMEALLSKI